MHTPDEPDSAHLFVPAAGGTQTSSSLVNRYLPLVYSVIAKYRLAHEQGDDAKHAAWLYPVPPTGFSSAETDSRPHDENVLPIDRHDAVRDGSG